MRVSIEIGHNLLRAIEKIIDHNENILSSSKREWSSDPVETSGDAIKKALGIDFTEIVREAVKIGPLEIDVEGEI